MQRERYVEPFFQTAGGGFVEEPEFVHEPDQRAFGIRVAPVRVGRLQFPSPFAVPRFRK